MAAQEWNVTRAFLATQEDKKTPEVVNTQGGPMHKYIFQVDEYTDWMNVLRKIRPDGTSNPLNVGDTVYGEINQNNYGKMQFQRVNRPQQQNPGYQPQANAPAPQQAAPVQQQAAPARINTTNPQSELEAKVDYLISILENFLNNQQSAQQSAAPQTVASDDDAPVNLDNLGY